MWEGATIYQPAHLFGMISALNPFSVQNVNIYKGVYDPKYDNRVGGIIDISSSDSIVSHSQGSAGITLTEAHANLEIPIIAQRMSVTLSGRQSIHSLYNSPPLNNYANRVFQFSKIDDLSEDAKEGFLNADQVLNFYDWNAQIKYRPSKRLFINAALYRNSQNFEYKLSFSDDPFNTLDKIESNTEALSTGLEWELNDQWKTSFSFIQSKYNSKNKYEEEESGDILTDYNQQNEITDESFSVVNSYENTWGSLEAGYDYTVKSVNYSLVNDNIYEPYFEDENIEQGHFHNLFSSVKIGGQQFRASAGIRASHYVEQSKWFLSPRLSLLYAINPQLKLKAEGGIFQQFISQLSDYGTSFIDVQNPLWILNTPDDNLSQSAKKIASGFIYRDKGWLFDIEGYITQTDGLSTLSPSINLLATDEFSRGSSTAIGLDLLIKKRWKKFNTWINYSLGKNTYMFPNISEETFAAPNDIRHTLGIVSSYELGDFQASIIGSFHSGLPYSLPDGIIDDFDEVDQETYYSINYVEINNDRLKPYTRLDINLNYRPDIKKLKDLKLEFSLSILNVLKRENEFRREFRLDFDDDSEVPRLAFIDRALLDRTPLLLMRVYW